MYSGEQVDSLTLQQALQSVIFPRQNAAQTQPCWLYQPASLVPYLPAWHWQQHWQKKLQQHPQHPDLLLLLQHPPVYTLGQGSSLEFLGFDLANPPAPIHRIERGGEVTYHCPGQLVGYPILNLHRYKTDLHWYLRQLEEVIIHLLASYQLQGERIAGLTGVWVDGQKVAAIGIKVSRWITMHGFALNVCPDLLGFQAIVPCGIADRPVGSLAGFLPNLRLGQVQAQLCASFAAVFGLEFIQQTWQELPED